MCNLHNYLRICVLAQILKQALAQALACTCAIAYLHYWAITCTLSYFHTCASSWASSCAPVYLHTLAYLWTCASIGHLRTCLLEQVLAHLHISVHLRTCTCTCVIAHLRRFLHRPTCAAQVLAHLHTCVLEHLRTVLTYICSLHTWHLHTCALTHLRTSALVQILAHLRSCELAKVWYLRASSVPSKHIDTRLSVGLMLYHCLRRKPNIKTTLGRRSCLIELHLLF